MDQPPRALLRRRERCEGKVTNYEVELGSPNKLLRYGWNRKSMQSGDSVTVEGFQSRDGAALINAKAVKFADGRSISAGSSLGGAQEYKE